MASVKEFLKRHSLKEGMLLEIKTSGGMHRGTLLPSNGKTMHLKLASGYNVGISPNTVKSVKGIERGKKAGKPKTKKPRHVKGLPSISILHTGGTIASRVNYETGGVIASFSAEDIVTMFPELDKTANVKSVFVENIMSEDINFLHYGKIAKAVKKELDGGAEGVIVTHGTDTLHYTAAALSFALEGLKAPVLLVGCQRSSDRPSSDAADNLLCAAHFIAKSDFAGVAICMHADSSDGKCAIIPGTRARKMHTSRRDAFKAINSEPIAFVFAQSGKIEFNSKNYKRRAKGVVEVKPKFEEKTGILKARPNLLPEEIDFFRKHRFKGLILETTGIGHMPINTKENSANLKALQALIKSGCVACATSQCIFGRVHESIYTNARRLHGLGAVFLEDMTTETAFIKLAWLLANNPKQAKELMPKNLHGEISQRRKMGGFEPGK